MNLQNESGAVKMRAGARQSTIEVEHTEENA
jgi:hypothetical protein